MRAGHDSRALCRAGLFALISSLFVGAATVLSAASSAPVDSTPPVPSAPSIGDTILTDVAETWSDALLLFASPARFDRGDWLLVGSGLAATSAAMLSDDRVRDLLMRNHSEAADRVADVGNSYGTPWPAAAVAGALYIGGLAFDAPGVRRAGRHVVQSVLYAAAITYVAKTIIGRHRPMLNHGPFRYNGPTFNDDYNSLPSGHTTLAFAVSSSLAADIDNPFATAGLYALATVTAASRIYADRHWFSDTMLGAMIGTACGYGVVRLHDPEARDSRLLLYPRSDGIGMLYRF